MVPAPCLCGARRRAHSLFVTGSFTPLRVSCLHDTHRPVSVHVIACANMCAARSSGVHTVLTRRATSCYVSCACERRPHRRLDRRLNTASSARVCADCVSAVSTMRVATPQQYRCIDITVDVVLVWEQYGYGARSRAGLTAAAAFECGRTSVHKYSGAERQISDVLAASFTAIMCDS